MRCVSRLAIRAPSAARSDERSPPLESGNSAGLTALS
jgi:hypothetical protein